MSKQTNESIQFLLDESARCGVCAWSSDDATRRALARAAQRGVCVRPYPGLYAKASAWESLDKAEQHLCVVRTLAQRHPEWVFSHVSAAVVYGLEVSWSLLDRIHVVVPKGAKARDTAWLVHHGVDAAERACVNSIGVTMPEQTVFDCVRSLDLREGLAITDSYLRHTGKQKEDLIEYIKQYPGCPRGRSMALLTAGYANGLSENGGESKARAAMLLYGYQEPMLQVTIEDPFEGNGYRGDFLWFCEDSHVVDGELDGYQKYLDPSFKDERTLQEVLDRERLRESRISAAGIVVMRFRLKETYRRAAFCRLLDCYGVPRVSEGLIEPYHPTLLT